MTKHAVIIGAGIIGCATALALQQRGWQVTLTDRRTLGDESSWAAGGVLLPLLPWFYREEVHALAHAGAAQMPAFCERLAQATGIDAEYWSCGMTLLPPYDETQIHHWCTQHSIPYERQANALWFPQTAELHPPRLLRALRATLLQNGATLHENTPMQPLSHVRGKLDHWQSVAGTPYTAQMFVLCAGAWSNQLLGTLQGLPQHKPMRGQIVMYHAPELGLDHIIYRDNHYLIPRRDGHILVGSTVEDAGFRKTITPEAYHQLCEHACRILPALRHLTPIAQWTGLRPGSPDNIPVIDRHPQIENVYLHSGHFRYGITMAPASAELMAQLMCNEPLQMNLAPYRYPLP